MSKQPLSNWNSTLNRRRFLTRTALASASLTIVSPRVLGRGGAAPSDRLDLAFIGAAGRAEENLRNMATENIVALCDVDDAHAAQSYERYDKAERYRDFRTMLDKHGDNLDGVVISTPDHSHAFIALDAIGRGKNVYVEKPLAHSIYEVRTLMAAAKKQNVITQLGNQGHSYNDIRTVCEWIGSGAIGAVNEVQVWYTRQYGDGKPRPVETPEVPPTLDWNLWLGPAPERPYNPVYLPGKWRSWNDFGTGSLGDWVCHILDPAFWALKLDAPETIRAKNGGGAYSPERFPLESEITYIFPPRGDRPPVKVVWTFGRKPEIPQLKGVKLDDWNSQAGAILIGEKGCIVHGSHGAGNARIIPESLAKAVGKPDPVIPRVEGNHQQDWIRACKSGEKAGSDFTYGGPLSEVALLGVIATAFEGEELKWNAENAAFDNHAAATARVKPAFRDGWAV